MEPKELPSFIISLLLIAYTWQLEQFSDSPEGTDTGTTVCLSKLSCKQQSPTGQYPTFICTLIGEP